MTQEQQTDIDTGLPRPSDQVTYSDTPSAERWAEIEAEWAALDSYYGPLIEQARLDSEAALVAFKEAADTHAESLDVLKKLRDAYSYKRAMVGK